MSPDAKKTTANKTKPHKAIPTTASPGKFVLAVLGIILTAVIASIAYAEFWLHRVAAQAQIRVTPISDNSPRMPHRVEFRNVGTPIAQDFRHSCMVRSVGDDTDYSAIATHAPGTPVNVLATDVVASDIDQCWRTTNWQVGKPPRLTNGDKLYIYVCYKSSGADPVSAGYTYTYSASRLAFATEKNDNVAVAFFRGVSSTDCAGY